MNYYLHAITEYFPSEKVKSRFFRDEEPDKDGDILYHYLFDPYSVRDLYFIRPVLIRKYEDAKVGSLLRKFSESIVNQTQIIAVQLPWWLLSFGKYLYTMNHLNAEYLIKDFMKACKIIHIN